MEQNTLQVPRPQPVEVTLHEAADAKYFHSPIKLRCLIAGHGIAPYIIPRVVEIEVTTEDGVTSTIDHTFEPYDECILSLLECSKLRQKGTIKDILRIPRNSSIVVNVIETQNVEEIFLIPCIDHEKDQGPYTMRSCYYVGKGLETNRVYDLIGYTLPHPNTQAATHIFTEAAPAETNLDSFVLSEEKYAALKTTFQAEDGDVYAKFTDIASQFADHVTRIYGRADLHAAVDLVFHSPLSFDFDKVRVRKGWLEGLILGDTRTGKGFVTEGLVRHYGVGEVVNGENLTAAGIIGGVQPAGGKWILVWGKIPLGDKRLVVLDECGSLPYADIGRLSRIRSEGIAEITKVISEKTTARTRLIWLANPRILPGSEPRMVADYNYGIEAVSELIGAAEDVARFDFALIVAQSEVSSAVINQHHTPQEPLRYTSEICRDLIMWVWSRTPEQIIFEDGVTDLALRAAKDLGNKFIPKICLIQAEDVRYKLARIACAAAARTFSSPDGVHLVVKRVHMEYAYNFLHHIYSKPCSGYLQMSESEKDRSTLRNDNGVAQILQDCSADSIMELINGLMEHHTISARDICDYAGLDIHAARGLISQLVQERALIKKSAYYVKKPAFRTLLQRMKAKLTEEVPATEEDNYDHSDSDSDSDNNHTITSASST